MRRFLTGLVALPLSVVIVALAVANRRPVTVSLDPFSPDAPALAFTLPLFVLVLGAVILGLVIGGSVTWVKQSRFRREARHARRHGGRPAAPATTTPTGSANLPATITG